MSPVLILLRPWKRNHYVNISISRKSHFQRFRAFADVLKWFGANIFSLLEVMVFQMVHISLGSKKWTVDRRRCCCFGSRWHHQCEAWWYHSCRCTPFGWGSSKDWSGISLVLDCIIYDNVIFRITQVVSDLGYCYDCNRFSIITVALNLMIVLCKPSIWSPG